MAHIYVTIHDERRLAATLDLIRNHGGRIERYHGLEITCDVPEGLFDLLMTHDDVEAVMILV